MRAAAILGPGCPPKKLKVFQSEKRIGWHMGVPSADDEVEAVVVFSGDGTIHRHLNALVRLGLPVLMVPAGSGNDFARALGFHSVRDSMDAWRRFCSGKGNVRSIDLGRIQVLHNEAGEVAPDFKYFCTIAGIGLDGEVARRANNFPRWLRGHGGYVLGFASTAFRFAPIATKVLVQDQGGQWIRRSDQPTLLAAFANTAAYGGGMKIAPQARIDDGELDVCVIGGVDPFKLFCMFPTVYVGRHLKLREVSYFKAPLARIETENPVDVYADGEFVCRTPVEIGVQRAALKVLTP
jgi:diacylglycerol kinase (ATP)